MKKDLVLLIATLVVAFSLMAGIATAANNEWPDDVVPHGHVMLIDVEVIEGIVHFDKCVEFAAGRVLRGPAHHNSVHTGAAGGSPRAPGALFHAGNWVVPLEPFGFGTGCESFTGPFPLPG